MAGHPLSMIPVTPQGSGYPGNRVRPSFRLALPAQSVDATHSNPLIRQYFPGRSDLLPAVGQILPGVVFRVASP